MDSFVKGNKLGIVAAVGCGVALGLSGIYWNYSYHLNEQIVILKNEIDELKKEVEEIKIASQRGSPTILTPYSQSQRVDTVDFYNHSHCTDDNDEFFDFTESEESISMNGAVNDAKVDETLSLEIWLKHFDVLLEDALTDKELLYAKINEGREKFGPVGDILWRQAKSCHLLGLAFESKGDRETKKSLTFQTLEYATEAVKVDTKNSECHKWYAIAIGSMSDYITTKEKIANGYEFKKHIDIALELKPNDPTLHHMLGRWSFEVANLGWVERKLASTLFAKVPESSNDDALNALLNAYKLKPQWKENLLFIAKVYIILKMYSKANEYIAEGLDIISKGEDDKLAHKELLALQNKFNKYR